MSAEMSSSDEISASADAHAPVSQPNRLIWCLLLSLATLALYNPVTHAPFLNYDDPVYVTNNPQVRAGLNWISFLWAFHTPSGLGWHPITWLSYLLDSSLFGQNPDGYHTTNLLLHAANVVLLFLILQNASGFVWRSLAVATLFAVHPVNVESVAWIAERRNVLSMFFFLLTLAAYGWYARRPGLWRHVAVTVAFAMALMSKLQVITFPFVALLLDYWPLRRIRAQPVDAAPARDEALVNPATEAKIPAAKTSRLLAEKIPWLAMSLAGGLIALRTGSAFSNIVASGEAPKFPLWIRLATAVIGTLKYLEKFFWPRNFALLYPHPGFATSIPLAVMSALLIAAITIVVILRRHNRPLFVGWFWFLITLAPMSGIVEIGPHSMADRYAYLPLLGVFLIVCWGVADLIGRWQIPATASISAAALLFLALAFALHQQVSLWRSNIRLWAHTVAVTGPNFTAEENLATALLAENKMAEALPHLERAHALQPADPLATLNLATFKQMLGRNQEALAGYADIIRLRIANPSLMATALANSGYAHLSLKQYQDAQTDFESALRARSDNWSAYRGLGLLEQRSGDIAGAARDYQRSVELQPSPVGYLLLAHAFEIEGQPGAAHEARLQASRLDPDLSDDIATVNSLLSQ
jgi:protein O-mannosyl-transferase